MAEGAHSRGDPCATDSDFVDGIRFSRATAVVLLAFVLATGFACFPRGKGFHRGRRA
jgi:hypothetical protein